MPPLSSAAAASLRSVTVRPVRDRAERRRWDALMAAHHYLPYHGLFGRALRHVAEWEGEWVALLGWQSGALKLSARDRWIGWLPAQQYRRLHLIANNARFLILPGPRVANLASRVLGLSLRHLSGDWRRLRGHPALLAETFVDPSRFHGGCYRAANWQSVGFTGGYARRGGRAPRWDHHGQPKEVFMYELEKHAAARLCRLDEEPAWRAQGPVRTLDAAQMCSLYAHLRTVPDYRDARGKRYQLATVLTLAVAARLAGYRGAVPLAEFAQGLSQETLAALHSHYNPRLGRYTAPQKSTFHEVLSRLPSEALDQALRGWAKRLGGAPGEGVALDGKCLRGAARQAPEGSRTTLVSAVTHGSGVVLGQEAVAEKSNEIPALRKLVSELDLAGRVVTMDAMHTQSETARTAGRQGADYVMTAVKENQPTMLADLVEVDWERADCVASEHCTRDKDHGRVETRRGRTVDLRGPQWDGFVRLPHRRQGLRIVRERYHPKTGRCTVETAYAVTSLGPEQADAERLMALVRGHWTIENRLHHVRDVTYDEDRCRAYKGELARNLASLSNLAISIIRHQGFRTLPPANRYSARHPEAALDAILSPLPA